MKNVFLAFYLALKEVFRNKGRFLLVSLVIALITLLVLFIAAVWQAVRHIRRLEPGITNGQSRSVTLGWGCGAIVAAVVIIVAALWVGGILVPDKFANTRI